MKLKRVEFLSHITFLTTKFSRSTVVMYVTGLVNDSLTYIYTHTIIALQGYVT